MTERILLVDDEPKVLSALSRGLGQRFDLRCAGGGAEALAMLETDGPFAAVISDLRMPGMSGLELLCEIRRRAPETVRMILSGHSDFKAVVGAINEGAVFRFHTKPVTPEVLGETLEIALLQHQREKQGGGRIDPSAGLVRDAGEFRRALSEGQLRLYLQPQASMVDGTVTGAEALVRWEHPDRGLLLPDCFLGIAESAGLMGHITAWMLNAACAEIRRWLDLGLPPLRIAVNITAMDLAEADFPDQVRRVLQHHDVAPRWLELELTEAAAVGNMDAARTTLGALVDLGIKLSIDDFGTGYSSVGWLRHLPVTKLKIDRSFIEDVTDDPEAYHFLNSIMTLAHDLKLNTLAEGIETAEQMALVARTGCDLVQGYFLARPMPADDFPSWVAAHTPRSAL